MSDTSEAQEGKVDELCRLQLAVCGNGVILYTPEKKVTTWSWASLTSLFQAGVRLSPLGIGTDKIWLKSAIDHRYFSMSPRGSCNLHSQLTNLAPLPSAIPSLGKNLASKPKALLKISHALPISRLFGASWRCFLVCLVGLGQQVPGCPTVHWWSPP